MNDWGKKFKRKECESIFTAVDKKLGEYKKSSSLFTHHLMMPFSHSCGHKGGGRELKKRDLKKAEEGMRWGNTLQEEDDNTVLNFLHCHCCGGIETTGGQGSFFSWTCSECPHWEHSSSFRTRTSVSQWFPLWCIGTCWHGSLRLVLVTRSSPLSGCPGCRTVRWCRSGCCAAS